MCHCQILSLTFIDRFWRQICKFFYTNNWKGYDLFFRERIDLICVTDYCIVMLHIHFHVLDSFKNILVDSDFDRCFVCPKYCSLNIFVYQPNVLVCLCCIFFLNQMEFPPPVPEKRRQIWSLWQMDSQFSVSVSRAGNVNCGQDKDKKVNCLVFVLFMSYVLISCCADDCSRWSLSWPGATLLFFLHERTLQGRTR